MISVTKDSKTIYYKYNSDGLRVAKFSSTDTTYYLIDPTLPYGQVIAKYGKDTTFYVYGLQREVLVSKTDTSFYVYDGQGSVRHLVDNNELITDSYNYDAYGNIVSMNGISKNEFLYRGEQFDIESGNYYLRARYYAPNSGTFLSVDPFSGDENNPVTLNKYLYGNGNPVMFSDPSGNFGIGELTAVIAIAGILATLPEPVYGKIGSEYWLEFIDSKDRSILYNGKYGLKNQSMVLNSFYATSGHRDFKKLFNSKPPAVPSSKYRTIPADSPLPIGDYYINIHEAGTAKAISVYFPINNRLAWELSPSVNGGIESIPNIGNRINTWGEYRMRIFAQLGTNTFGRDNFYIHGITLSTFIYLGTSGCIGVNQRITNLVENLRQYRIKSKKNNIKLSIK